MTDKMISNLETRIDRIWEDLCNSQSTEEKEVLDTAANHINLLFQRTPLEKGEYKVKIIEDSYSDVFLYVAWIERGSLKNRFFTYNTYISEE